MQKYLNQLLEDIEQAIIQRWTECPPHFYLSGIPDPYLKPPKGWTKRKDKIAKEKQEEEFSLDAMLEETDNYVYQEPKDTMFYSLGFYRAQFPPAEKFTDEALEQLTFAIRRLWAAFNFSASTPKNTPARIIYPLLVERMKKPAFVMNFGQIGIEFCDYEPDRCPFGLGYCSCKISYERMDREEKEREENMKQVLQGLNAVLASFPENGTFRVVDKFFIPTNTTIKTIAEWIDIDINLFPESYLLNEKQAETIAQAILLSWQGEVEFIAGLTSLHPRVQYGTLVQLLKEKAYYNGNYDFRLPDLNSLNDWKEQLAKSAEVPYQPSSDIEDDFWDEEMEEDEDFPF